MRVTTSKSKNSESFYINFAFIDKIGKSISRTFKKLSTLKELSEKLNTGCDGVMAWAKQRVRKETIKYNEENEVLSIPFSPNQLIDKDKQRTFNCGCLLIQSLLSLLRLDYAFRNIKFRHAYDYDFHSIFSDLFFSRILHPASKSDSYTFARTLLETSKYKMRDIYIC